MSREAATDNISSAPAEEAPAEEAPAEEAGADEAGADDQGQPEATAPPAPAPDYSLLEEADPAEPAAVVVFADGTSTELTFGSVGEVVLPTVDHEEFVGLVFPQGEPPNFDLTVLFQLILAAVIDHELALADTSVSEETVTAARTRLFSELQPVFAASPDPQAEFDRLYREVPYLSFFAELQSRQIALSDHLASAAEPGEGDPCVRHILVETQDEADALQVELAGGADFATLAQEHSTGPSGPDGGDIGCAPAERYVPEFAAAVQEATVGEYVGPIQTEFGWHILVVDRYEVDGTTMARAVVETGLAQISVEVDERLGRWDSTTQNLVPPGS